MPTNVITCPNCQSSIELTEALTHQIRQDLVKELQPQLQQREALLRQKEADLQKRASSIDSQVEAQVSAQVSAKMREVQAKALEQAKTELGGNLTDMQTELASVQRSLREAKDRERSMLDKEAKLKEKLEDAELEVLRQVNLKTDEIRAEADRKWKLKEQEYSLQSDSLKRKVEELQQKLEQGSQQLQGEAAELELENALALAFPMDEVEPIGKGVKGGDCLLKVFNALGNHVGTILFERKRTKSFSDGWIQKLKDDMIESKADIGVILSSAMPKDVDSFGELSGVWVTNHQCCIGVVTALRSTLLQVASQKQLQLGKQTTAGLLFEFVIGSEFRQRVENIVAPFIEMQQGLMKEKRAMQKSWSTREKQLERVLDSIAGLTGSLQGITGQPIELPEFELEGLPPSTNDDSA